MLRTMKRIRGRNFTDKERQILFALVNKYRQIFEVRKNDVKSNREKTDAWNAITRTFNSQFPDNEPRKPENLKMCYENHRKRVKSLQHKRVDGMTRKLNGKMEEIIIEEMNAFKSERVADEDDDNYEYYFATDDGSSNQEPTSGVMETIEEPTVTNEIRMPDTSLEGPMIEEFEPAIEREPPVAQEMKRMNSNEFEYEQHELQMKILNFDYQSKVQQHKLKMTILETELKLKLKELNRYK